MSKKAIAIGVLALGILVFLPQILSTTIGKRFFIHTIERKTGGEAGVEKLKLSWFGPQEASGISIRGEGYKGTIERVQAEIALWKFGELLKPENLFGFKGNLSLQGAAFKFQPDASLDGVNASFRLHEDAADLTATGQSSVGEQGGSFSIQGHVGKGFSLQGEMTAFPTVALAHYLAMSQDVDQAAVLEIVGASFSLKGFATMQEGKGACDLSLHAPNGDVEVRGNLKEDLFTLSEPLRGSIRLTPLLAQRILQGVNPLFVTGISSENPIQFRFETRGFRLFLARPFRWSSIQIGGGMIDMGKIRCSNGSTLGALISMLKNNPLARTKEMTVWFAPLFFKLENGVLQTGRMDALAAKSVRFCTWGNIDLVKDKLDMTLGLTAETLKKAFGVKRITDNYVLKIPITGSIRDPKLGVAAGAAKIAALVAAQHAPKGAGGLLNLFLQPDSDVPPPNQPFPWDQ